MRKEKLLLAVKVALSVLLLAFAISNLDLGAQQFGGKDCWCNDHTEAGWMCYDDCGGWRGCNGITLQGARCVNGDWECYSEYFYTCTSGIWNTVGVYEYCPECNPQQ